MKTSAKLEVQLLIDGCKRIGISHIVISPGSRNAPLSIAFDEDPTFTVHVIVDERSAAFYALGMAQELKAPVAIACTSGSAPLNYYPAIAEAFYQGIPLVILTADRPKEWTDQGDGQTIRQENVFANHVLKSVQLDPIHSDSQRWLVERQLSEVLQAAIGFRKGPVHLNLPFSEPLYATTDVSQSIQKWIHQSVPTTVLSENDSKFIQSVWGSAQKRLVIVGQMEYNSELELILKEWTSKSQCAVLVEHTSNIKSTDFISCIDRVLNQMDEHEINHFLPDCIITIGEAVVSKRIKTFLRKSNAPVIQFGSLFPFMDTYQNLVFTAAISPFEGLKSLSIQENPSDIQQAFANKWIQLEHSSEMKHHTVISEIPYSDLKVMDAVLKKIPKHTLLHISNSSMIRYALLFQPFETIHYRCNRGTSGIDGCTSTAIGAALVSPQKLHVLITGDLSFFYDSNALWNSNLPSNLRIIVVNNGGGDIFNIIPGPSSTNQLDKIFVATHSFSAEKLCEAFQVTYDSVADFSQLENSLDQLMLPAENNRSKVLEIKTIGINNSAFLQRYFDEMKKLQSKEKV